MMPNPPKLTQAQYRFTLCFLYHNDKVLMIERNKEPNLGLWNGVGGHIELGESPEASCIREIQEETGIVVPALRFGGVLTWDSWSFEAGGMYFFSAEVDDTWFQHSDEGNLAWKPYEWVITSPKVVENISEFIPDTRENRSPRWYHCLFDQEILIETYRYPLPAWITNNWIKTGQFRI